MDINADVLNKFRLYYGKFKSTSKYPDDTVSLALAYSDFNTGGAGWGLYEDKPQNLKQSGMFAWAAHWLAVTFPSDASNDENMSGASQNLVSSKSIGDQSVSYAIATPTGTQGLNDGYYSSTQFGQNFLQLRTIAQGASSFITL